MPFQLTGGGQVTTLLIQPNLKHPPRTEEYCPGKIHLNQLAWCDALLRAKSFSGIHHGAGLQIKHLRLTAGLPVSAASMYFSICVGDKVRTDPRRSKPFHSGSSKSPPGSVASSTPMRSRIVLTYSSRVSRRSKKRNLKNERNDFEIHCAKENEI